MIYLRKVIVASRSPNESNVNMHHDAGLELSFASIVLTPSPQLIAECVKCGMYTPRHRAAYRCCPSRWSSYRSCVIWDTDSNTSEIKPTSSQEPSETSTAWFVRKIIDNQLSITAAAKLLGSETCPCGPQRRTYLYTYPACISPLRRKTSWNTYARTSSTRGGCRFWSQFLGVSGVNTKLSLHVVIDKKFWPQNLVFCYFHGQVAYECTQT